MKKFLVNSLIFIGLFILFDRSFLLIRNYSPSTQKDIRLEQILNGNMNKDLLIFGSSRGARDIYAGLIEKRTGLKTYNLSYPGSDIEFHEFLLRSVLKFNKKPNKVILVVDDPSEFFVSTVKYRLDVLYPLVKYKFVRDELVKRGEKNNLLSKLFVLHQLNKANFKFKTQKFTLKDTIYPNGSMLLTFQKKNIKWDSTTNVLYNKKKEINSKREAFLDFQNLCYNNNIKLLIVAPPNYYQLNDEFIKRIKELKSDLFKLYIYNKKNLEYRDKNNYYNKGHLNKNGAIIFTEELLKNNKDFFE